MKTFKDYLIEKIIQLPKDENDKSIESSPVMGMFKRNNVQDMGNVDNYKVVHVNKGSDVGPLRKDRILLYSHDGKAAGGIDYHKMDKGHMAYNIYLHSHHQGKGLMPKVFKHVMNNGINLIPSSGDHTKGGLSIWKTLKMNEDTDHENWLGTDDVFHQPEKTHVIKDASEKLHKRKKLNDNEIGSVNSYIAANHLPEVKHNSGYRILNGHLRGTLDSDVHLNIHAKNIDPHILNKHTNNIDSAIAKHTIDHHIHVWRGFHRNAGINKLNPGEIFHDKGYVSTTTDPDYAKHINHILTHIKIPKGSKALAVNKYDNHFNNKNEHEIILPRNSKFRYDGYTDHGSMTRVHHLTHIPEES